MNENILDETMCTLALFMEQPIIPDLLISIFVVFYQPVRPAASEKEKEKSAQQKQEAEEERIRQETPLDKAIIDEFTEQLMPGNCLLKAFQFNRSSYLK